MKLFMMPQTVPNEADEGRGRTDGREHAGRRGEMRAAEAASRRSSREAMRSLMPSRLQDRRRKASAPSRPRPRKCRDLAARIVQAARTSSAGVRTPASAFSRGAHPPPRRENLDGLGKPYGPGDNRGNGKPDQTAFTTGSALRNMPQGVRSRGSVALPRTGASLGSCAGDEHGKAMPAKATKSVHARTTARSSAQPSPLRRRLRKTSHLLSPPTKGSRYNVTFSSWRVPDDIASGAGYSGSLIESGRIPISADRNAFKWLCAAPRK